MSTPPKTWSATKCQHLYRHKSGTYYARIKVGGQKTWRSLKTAVLSVAKAELDELLRDEAARREISAGTATVSEHLTGAEALEIRKRQIDNDPSLKTSSRRLYREVLATVQRTWPKLATSQLRFITQEQCEEWAGRARNLISASRFNTAVSTVRELFKIAIKRGVRRTNPSAELKRVKPRAKDLSSRLPTRQMFLGWVNAIRAGGARYSQSCADLVEFLAYTGVRLGEAKWIEWQHVDFERGTLLVVGEPNEGTKNREIRRVDLIPAARELLARLRKSGAKAGTKVLAVGEAQKSMVRAAKGVGMAKITHHDLRHFFATICIESGVDIPTVSRWMGHKDGGVLAMKVYGHLRAEHSQAAAARVSFAA